MYIHSFLLLEAHLWYIQVASYVCMILALVLHLHYMSTLTIVQFGEMFLLQSHYYWWDYNLITFSIKISYNLLTFLVVKKMICEMCFMGRLYHE